MNDRRWFPRLAQLGQYFWVTYLALLVNASGYLWHVGHAGVPAAAVVGVVFLTHCMLYLLPVWLVAAVLDMAFSPRLLGHLVKWPGAGNVVVYGFALLGFTVVQNLIFADKFIFRLWGFHLNGFVWNLVFTRGGIESLGGSPSTKLTAAAIVLGFLALQAGLLVVVLKVSVARTWLSRIFSRRVTVTALVVAAVLLVSQAVAYGVCSLLDYTPVLAAGDTFPAHVHITFARFAKRRLGLKADKRQAFAADTVNLNYPLHPLVLQPDRKKYNIVWLVAESWRKDMLNPETMPATWAFSQRAARFEQHYSGGNGTIMAMFGMFYGMYGPYWFAFKNERRGPVLMDVVVDDGYQMEMYTSARFTYPEFDRTIMARVPPENLHECDKGEGWERDRINTADLVSFIKRRDRSRPFMTFMFFESPHAHYYFPPECAIRKPYCEDVNYVTMKLGPEDVAKVKNRYINSCYHLDTQFARILRCLEEDKLLDSTIVVITGDHGEEFMEKGHWGHNSIFSEEQSIAPLVLWIPGRPPAVITRMTSHLDLPATVLNALGATNPPEDYSLGFDLFGQTERKYVVLSGYENICYVDQEYKGVFPVGASAYRYGQAVTTRDDVNIPDRQVFLDSRKDQLIEIMGDLKRFKR